MGGQWAGRADRAPGRCRAGEGIAWRQNLTGHLVSTAHLARSLAWRRARMSTKPCYAH